MSNEQELQAIAQLQAICQEHVTHLERSGLLASAKALAELGTQAVSVLREVVKTENGSSK